MPGNPQTFQNEIQPSTFLLPGPAARAHFGLHCAKIQPSCQVISCFLEISNCITNSEKNLPWKSLLVPWTGSVLIVCCFVSSFAWISASPNQTTLFPICSSQGHAARRFSRAADYCYYCNAATVSPDAFQSFLFNLFNLTLHWVLLFLSSLISCCRLNTFPSVLGYRSCRSYW